MATYGVIPIDRFIQIQVVASEPASAAATAQLVRASVDKGGPPELCAQLQNIVTALDSIRKTGRTPPLAMMGGVADQKEETTRVTGGEEGPDAGAGMFVKGVDKTPRVDATGVLDSPRQGQKGRGFNQDEEEEEERGRSKASTSTDSLSSDSELIDKTKKKKKDDKKKEKEKKEKKEKKKREKREEEEEEEGGGKKKKKRKKSD